MFDEDFLFRLEARLRDPLPGLQAQLKMAPMERRANVKRWNVPADARQSAVLVLLYPNASGVLHLPLQVRNAYNGVHSRQIGLPGGGVEAEDADYEATALRETEEEVGVPRTEVEVLGRLSKLYIPPSNYLVQPIVGKIKSRPDFEPDPSEVAELIETPLASFLDDGNVGMGKIKARTGGDYEVPCFNIQGKVVWGATAMMMSEFREVLLEL